MPVPAFLPLWRGDSLHGHERIEPADACRLHQALRKRRSTAVLGERGLSATHKSK
jgi:hypothetical protein